MTTLADWKRALLALYPPGAFSRDGSSLHGVLAEADAKILYRGAQAVEALENEPFPALAVECLDEWEAFYKAPHPPGATTVQRQAFLSARWRGGMAFNLVGLRAIVADILNPEYVWRDAFDNGIIDWRYQQDLHNATLVETAGVSQVLAVGAVDARWDATNKLGATSLLPLIRENARVTDDDFWFATKVTANGLVNNGSMAGVCIYQDDGNAQWWGIWRIGGVNLVRSGWICGNIVGGPVVSVAVPALPFWLVIGRVAGVTQLYLEADPLPSPIGPAVLSAPQGSIILPISPREVGIFLWQDASLAASLIFGEHRMFYRLKHHNVEIAENCLATLSGPTDTNRFFCFIRRPVADYGSGDLLRAALEVDKFKPGHVTITVGESDLFLHDDPHSLHDRDVLGS